MILKKLFKLFCFLYQNLYISWYQNTAIMTKIETINFHSFSNKEHYQFMSDFDQLLSIYPAALSSWKVLYGVFQNTLMAEDLALRVEQGSRLSVTLEQLDHLRDKTWIAINIRVKATLLSPFEEQVESAQAIQQVLQHYGDICALTYYEQSLALTNLANDLRQPMNEVHINKMGLLEWVSELKSQNQQFKAVYIERNSAFAGRESGDVKAVRTLLDPVYEQLIDKINASIVLEFAPPEVIAFAIKLNAKIKYYNNTIPISFSSPCLVGEKEKEAV